MCGLSSAYNRYMQRVIVGMRDCLLDLCQQSPTMLAYSQVCDKKILPHDNVHLIMINIQSSHVFRSTCMGTPRCRENSYQFVNSTYTASEHGVICLSSIMLTRASEALTELQSAVCQVIYGKITLCDLAGSERPKKSEVSPRPGSGFRLCLPLSRGLLH